MSQGLAKPKALTTTDGSTVDVCFGRLNTEDEVTTEMLTSILIELKAIRTILSIGFNVNIKDDDIKAGGSSTC